MEHAEKINDLKDMSVNTSGIDLVANNIDRIITVLKRILNLPSSSNRQITSVSLVTGERHETTQILAVPI